MSTTCRYRHGCDYDLRTLPDGPCPECGRAFRAADPKSHRANPRGQVERETLAGFRPTTLALLALVAIGACSASVRGANLMLVVKWTAVALLVVVPTMGVWVVLEYRARDPRPKQWLLAAILLVSAVSAVWTQWPMRVGFLLHRSALERLADQAERGVTPPLPVRVGLYTIRGIDTTSYHGVIGLHTDTNPSGPTGFYLTAVPVNSPPANEWSSVRLSERWWWIKED